MILVRYVEDFLWKVNEVKVEFKELCINLDWMVKNVRWVEELVSY